jgi:hypothetical protein
MKSKFAFAIGSLVFMHIALGQASRPAADMSVSELIDRLQGITNDDFQVQTNIIAIAQPAQMPQGLKFMQDPAPKPSEVMQELARRGAACLPQLCAHLDDARQTKALVQAMVGGLDFSAEYDWDPHGPGTRPSNVTSTQAFGRPGGLKIVGNPWARTYTLTVGDMCFKIIGEIVNRRFEPARYQPSAIVIVNSPVWCTDLASAVRKEWAGITPAQHRASLIRDVTQEDGAYHDESGVLALQRYYPDAIAGAIRDRLNLPVYDSDSVQNFVDGHLLTDTDLASRQKKIDQYIASHGPPYRDGIVAYLWPYRGAPVQGSWVVEPGTVLAQMDPRLVSDNPPALSATSSSENEEFKRFLKEHHLQ